MFHNQTPLQGGVGAMLMAKMGWKQGEGLGKNNEGVLEPLALDVKTDRKGTAHLNIYATLSQKYKSMSV